MSDYKTRYLARDEYEKWDELVSQSPASNIFDTSLWLDTLSSALNSNIRILGVFNNGDLIGGVAFNLIKRFGLKIAKVPPMSAFNSCQYILKETQQKDKLRKGIQNVAMAIVERLQNDFHYAVVTNYPDIKDINAFKWKGWRQNILYSYLIYLNKTDLSLISAAKRRQVKKARKRLVLTEEIKDVALVYDIIKRTYTRQGLKCPLALDELASIHKRMSSNMLILAAREPENGKCIATEIAVIDYNRKYVYSLINAYDIEFADSGANSLLLWESIALFMNKGVDIFDLGEAGTPSKSDFKSQFSTELVPYYQVSKSNLLFSIAWHLTRGRIAIN